MQLCWPNKILNPEGLRYDDEFVRHKILDAIGDMALLEYTLVGEYDAIAGSHHLNHLLTKTLWRWIKLWNNWFRRSKKNKL